MFESYLEACKGGDLVEKKACENVEACQPALLPQDRWKQAKELFDADAWRFQNMSQCIAPMRVYYRIRDGGKKQISFDKKDRICDKSGVPINELNIPCGQCIACRLRKAREWAIRCEHECSTTPYNIACFITLTYNDENLPDGETLVKRDLQLFMKSLRKKHDDTKIRFFGCGEYGTQGNRPHYHLILFGYDFPDREIFTKSGDFYVYRSEELEKLWQKGFSLVADYSIDTASYVASYVTKKVTGKQAKEHYGNRLPEFCLMSRRPGIGYEFATRFAQENLSNDSVLFKGFEVKEPAYYDKLYEKLHPEEFQKNKEKRSKFVRDATSRQLAVTAEKLQIKFKQKEKNRSF